MVQQQRCPSFLFPLIEKKSITINMKINIKWEGKMWKSNNPNKQLKNENKQKKTSDKWYKPNE